MATSFIHCLRCAATVGWNARPWQGQHRRRDGAMNTLSVRPLADSAATLSPADAVGEHAAAKAGAAVKAILCGHRARELLGATEVAGAFCSVTVHYDCLTVSQGDRVARLQGLLASTGPPSA